MDRIKNIILSGVIFSGISLCLFIVVDYFVVGEYLMPENGPSRFFSSRANGGRGYSFALIKRFQSLEEVEEPEHYTHPIESNICKIMVYGPSLEHEREWCYDGSEVENRVSVRTQNPSKIAFVFGGSFAFGDGLNNEETISSQLSNFSVNGFNFGMSGAGAHQFLAELYKNEHLQQSFDKPVILVYPFIWDHLIRQKFDRADCCFAWGPRFELNDKDQLSYIDNFKHVYPSDLKTFFMTVPNSAWLVKSFFKNHSELERVSFKDLKTHCSILSAIKSRAMKLYGESTKLLVLDMIGVEFQELVNCYEKNDIEYINIDRHFSEEFASEGIDKFFFRGDGHPTADLTKLIAELVASERK